MRIAFYGELKKPFLVWVPLVVVVDPYLVQGVNIHACEKVLFAELGGLGSRNLELKWPNGREVDFPA